MRQSNALCLRAFGRSCVCVFMCLCVRVLVFAFMYGSLISFSLACGLGLREYSFGIPAAGTVHRDCQTCWSAGRSGSTCAAGRGERRQSQSRGSVCSAQADSWLRLEMTEADSRRFQETVRGRSFIGKPRIGSCSCSTQPYTVLHPIARRRCCRRSQRASIRCALGTMLVWARTETQSTGHCGCSSMLGCASRKSKRT